MRFRNASDQAQSRIDLHALEREGYFASSQAQSFMATGVSSGGAALGLESVHHLDLSGSGQSGFSATLFRDTINQRYVLAIRGTEPTLAQFLQDIIEADIHGIATNGIAGPQFADLLIYVRQLSTAGGQPVTFSDDEVRQLARLRGSDSYLDPVIRRVVSHSIEEMRAQFTGIVGAGGASAPALLGDAPFVAVGHSLGGHLANLAGAYLGSRVSQVATFNAPGFSASRFAELLGVPLGPAAPTTNVEAFAGIELTAGFRGHPGTRQAGASPMPGIPNQQSPGAPCPA